MSQAHLEATKAPRVEVLKKKHVEKPPKLNMPLLINPNDLRSLLLLLLLPRLRQILYHSRGVGVDAHLLTAARQSPGINVRISVWYGGAMHLPYLSMAAHIAGSALAH